MSADYLNIDDADLSGLTKEMNKHSKGNKKKRGVSEFSRLSTEKERLDYLGYRNDVMSRTIVSRYPIQG